MLRYKANVTVNIRSTPAVTSTNDIGDIPAGTEFIGSGLVVGANGTKYVNLISAGGINKVGYVSTVANITLLEDTGTTPPPPPVSTFPESFILTEPDGKRAEYIFVREIE